MGSFFPRLRPRTAFEEEVIKRLNTIQNIVARIERNQGVAMQEFDQLVQQVQQNTDVEQSAIQLIQGLAAKLNAAAANPAQVKALSAQLSTRAQALAAAITANTDAGTTTDQTASGAGSTGAGTTGGTTGSTAPDSTAPATDTTTGQTTAGTGTTGTTQTS